MTALAYSSDIRITVIMPFRNCEKFLDGSIPSILNQSFTEFDFIIINDASTDNSDLCVQKYLSDKRIKYIKNSEPLGITKNLNKALSLTNTEYVVRMDGDDISEVSRITEQIKFMDENPAISVLGTWAMLIDENGDIIGKQKKISDPLFIKNNIFIYTPLFYPSVIFRTKDIIKVGGYDEFYENGQDMDLWIRLVCSGYQITNLPNYLIRYRYHGLSTAHKARINALRDLKIRIKHIKKFNIKVSIRTYIMIALQFAVGYLFGGRFRQKIERFYSQNFLLLNDKTT